MTLLGADWRIMDGVATAWFTTPSLGAGAALAGRVLERSDKAMVDIRSMGVRVRVVSVDDAEAVSVAAHDLGLIPDPTVLQQLSLVIESVNRPAVQPFWRDALGYDTGADGNLTDPLRRDPGVRIRQSDNARPLRNRIHLDVVRPAASVEQANLGPASGPYGVCRHDPDGNEIDFLPGDPLGDSSDTSDWQVVWGAMACYQIASVEQQLDLASAASALADEAGFPLMIDLRPGLVILDSGKDQADADAHGLDLDFTDLAARLQAVARSSGACVNPSLPRLVQLFVDAANIPAVRAFWLAALGYVRDRRDGVSDIYDPRRLGPVVVFQQIDIAETERRRQRGRISIELEVPADQVSARVARLVGAGGTLVNEAGESEERWQIADPEGNGVVIVGGR